MKTAEIRACFLDYFKKKGHTLVDSSSLVPQNDPTLLFTNAGMVQFKDVFLGKDLRAYQRAASSQKCVRAGGKHNDLENVGFTARHHTFFEMLGNFSFGDYFKKDAIHFAWDFVTQTLKLPKEKLAVSIFEKDDEAAQIWEIQEKIPRERIYRFGEKDNFWSMGDTGPCGPCTEIFIDRGEKFGCKKTTCQVGCSCDRFMEFWNLVFMQYERNREGTLAPLPKPSVDTGAGLERMASILQQVETNYETDVFLDIISKTEQLAGVSYTSKKLNTVSFRVIADHARATTFLIGDGVLPTNEGRGYVLRRIMRRAIRHGKKLGFTDPFFYKTAQFVIDQMKGAYPDLQDKHLFIEKAIQAEEEQFFKTLERGLTLLDEETEKLDSSKTLAGHLAFKLYDTYGFPLDLTRVICEEKNITLDESGFEKAMELQRSESRKHWKGSGESTLDSIYLELSSELKSAGQFQKFVGYEQTTSRSQCLALLVHEKAGLRRVNGFNSKGKGERIEAIFSEVPFYGESGGQVGDQGRVNGGSDGFEGAVLDAQKPVPDLIVAHVQPLKGSISVGDFYELETQSELRSLTSSNHTATHLLQWALREVLGAHVKQAGSLVSPELLRFDFTHFQSLTQQEAEKVEALVNDKIWNGAVVEKKVMSKEKAMGQGAIAFFGEKYGDEVRVIQVGDFSTELCGGTHVHQASEIHLFKIISESGIAAGVRRIIAYTSKGAFAYLCSRETELRRIQERFRASTPSDLLSKIEKMVTTEKELRRELEDFQSKGVRTQVDEMLLKAETLPELRLITTLCAPNKAGVQYLRDLSDRIKQKAPDVVLVLGMHEPGLNKAHLLISIGSKVSKKLNAHLLLQEVVSFIEGRGGGKADLAQAGGTKPAGLDKALQTASKKIRECS